MIVIENPITVWYDCDDTLVMWSASQEETEKYGVDFTCPGSLVQVDDNIFESTPWTAKLVPHKAHIEQLKKHKSRHTTVIVWSAAGGDWAKTVVQTLGLEQYVDLVISKPTWFYDDLPATEFMGEEKRKYIKE